MRRLLILLLTITLVSCTNQQSSTAEYYVERIDESSNKYHLNYHSLTNPEQIDSTHTFEYKPRIDSFVRTAEFINNHHELFIKQTDSIIIGLKKVSYPFWSLTLTEPIDTTIYGPRHISNESDSKFLTIKNMEPKPIIGTFRNWGVLSVNDTLGYEINRVLPFRIDE